jgi:hypothetical protein
LLFEDVIPGPILPEYCSSIRIFFDPREPAGLKHDGFYANITNALPCPTGVIFQDETLCLAPRRALRPGVHEYEVEAAIRYVFRKNGSKPLSSLRSARDPDRTFYG